MKNSRKAIIGFAGGMLAGLFVLGIGGRIIMRFIALLAGITPGFGIGGTLEVLAFGLIIGLPSGLIFPFVASYFPGSKFVKGGVYGILVFLTVILLPGEAKKVAFMFPEIFPFTVSIFLALFLVYGVVLATLITRLFTRYQIVSA